MNRATKKSRESYNKKADHYDETPEGRYTLEFKQKLVEEISLSRGVHVLDVACGNGTLLKMLADQWEIVGYGVDISEKMIDHARRKNPDMSFEVSGCERLPYEHHTLPLSKAGDVRFYSPKEIIRTFEHAGFRKLTVSLFGQIQIVGLQKM